MRALCTRRIIVPPRIKESEKLYLTEGGTFLEGSLIYNTGSALRITRRRRQWSATIARARRQGAWYCRNVRRQWLRSLIHHPTSRWVSAHYGGRSCVMEPQSRSQVRAFHRTLTRCCQRQLLDGLVVLNGHGWNGLRRFLQARNGIDLKPSIIVNQTTHLLVRYTHKDSYPSSMIIQRFGKIPVL
jgi:hypothetical protein